MCIANSEQITKILLSAGIALSCAVMVAATASADPNTVETGANPFGTLSCSCRQTAPADGPALKAAIDRGLQEGHSAWLPGLPAPARHGQR
jgi:hypothetical protein